MLTLAVPIFNKAQYLPRCIDALLDQTVRDYEILLIDDESPDRCGEICEGYSARFPEKVLRVPRALCRAYYEKKRIYFGEPRRSGVCSCRSFWLRR